MKFMKYFSKRTVSSTEIRSTGSTGETPGPMSSSNVASGIQAAPTIDTLEANQMVPQSITDIPNDRGSSSADQPRRDPALDNPDKVLSALQMVSGMVLPLGLPKIAKSASHLLSILENKRRNDAGVKDLKDVINLVLDISKIILNLVKPLEESPTVTTEQQRIVENISSYLKTLDDYCNEYLQGKWLSRAAFTSAWSAKIDGIRQGIQTQLQLVNTAAIMEVLHRVNSPRQTPQDQSFHNAEFDENCNVELNSFSVLGADPSRPVPRILGTSNAFKDTKFRGNVKINNHSHLYKE